MSREIKFRAWDKKTNKMYSLDSLAWDLSDNLDDVWLCGVELDYNDKEINVGVRSMNEVVLEQYTGLKDRNGKEIYEGDIVRVGFWDGSYKVLYQVVWRRSDCRFIFENKSREESYPLKDDINNDGYEVIGNIHESNMEELCPKE